MVLIDATYINDDTLCKSLSIYIFRFLDAIEHKKIKNYKILVLSNMISFMKSKYPNFIFIHYDPYASDKRNRLLKFYYRCKSYKEKVNRSGCETVFVPNDLVMFSVVKTIPKKVVVIHDLKSINEKKKLSFSFIVFWLYYWFLILYAEKVIAVSNYTKSDILRFFGRTINRKKLYVVYNSVDIRIPPTLIDVNSIGVKKPYLLFVNTLLPYKNIKTLIKAYALMDSSLDYNLLVVGKETEYWRNEILPLIETNHLKDSVVRLEDVSSDDLIALYQNASLFVSPSLKEGFGYTPIEAAICKCPVVCSHCEALEDTTRGLLNYYEPATDEVKLMEAIVNILATPPTYEELSFISSTFKNLYSREKQYNELNELLNGKE